MCLAMYTCIVLCIVTARVLIVVALYNAARFKPSNQSTTFEGYSASRGVDGNYDGYISHGYCQHTDLQYAPWWIVDLLGQFVVQKILLTNRNDDSTAARRLKNFTIDIFDEDPTRLANFPNITGNVCYYQADPMEPTTSLFNCSAPITGRYVRIVMRNNEKLALHFCETEVLVSSSVSEHINFKRYLNTLLDDIYLVQLYFKESFLCVLECLLRRLSTYCTAVNWITSTGSCQLFSVNPFLDLTARLISDQKSDFFIQSN
ncbi:fucolectin-7 [Biomphalaria glabrata]|nr:fucolectin-7 [Biomphalaria glabrata]